MNLTCDQCSHDGKAGVPATHVWGRYHYCGLHADYHQRLRNLKPLYPIVRAPRRSRHAIRPLENQP